MKISEITSEEYSQNNGGYLSVLPQDAELMKSFEANFNEVLQLFQSIPLDKLDFRYAANKWSIKEVLQHVIDTERIFIYRCFRIARHDKTPLTGFEQDDYLITSQAAKKDLVILIEEFKAVRQNSLALLHNLNEADLKFIGIVNGNPLSARAAAFNIIGHTKWHLNMIKERYL